METPSSSQEAADVDDTKMANQPAATDGSENQNALPSVEPTIPIPLEEKRDDDLSAGGAAADEGDDRHATPSDEGDDRHAATPSDEGDDRRTNAPPDAGAVLQELAARTALALEDAVEFAKSSVPGGAVCQTAVPASPKNKKEEEAGAQPDKPEEVADKPKEVADKPDEAVEKQAAATPGKQDPTQGDGAKVEEGHQPPQTVPPPSTAKEDAPKSEPELELEPEHNKPEPEEESAFSASAIAALIREHLSASVSACVSGDMGNIECSLGGSAAKAEVDDRDTKSVRSLHLAPSEATSPSIFPLRSFPSNLLDMDAQGETEEEMAQEIADRRLITTNVLGADVLEHMLRDKQTNSEASCLKCGMPLVVVQPGDVTSNGQDRLDCVVCPELVRKSDEEAKRAVEEQRKKEEARIEAERAAKVKAEAERVIQEQKRVEEERRRAEEEREAKKKREEEERLAEEARRVEEARRAEEAARAEEARRKEEELRKEEARKAEEARQAELARKAKESEKAEEERVRREEEARLAAEAHIAELNLHAERLMLSVGQYDGEDHHSEGPAETILEQDPSKEEEGWIGRRKKSRSIMVQKLGEGWSMLSDTCEGHECEFNPLMEDKEGSTKLCTVCGGCGSGSDGAYAEDAEHQEQPREDDSHEEDAAEIPAVTSTLTIGDIKSDRASASREIGKLLVAGWSKLKEPCPACFMPLVVPPKVEGSTEESHGRCVICGPAPGMSEEKTPFSL